MTIHPKVWSLAPWGAALMLFVILVAIDTDMSLLSAVVLAVGVLGWLIAKAFVTVAHVLFGGHVVARILAFGVAVLLFPDMVLALFRAPAALIRYLSQSVPMLATVWPQLQSGDPQSLAVVAKLIDGALASAELPLLQIIFGFVTWVAFGHLLSFVFLHVDKIAATIGTTAKRFPSLTGIAPSVFAAVRSIPSAFWAHTAVIVTLAMGVYLILGAIATIPYLSQESAPLEEITARLSTTLDGIQRTEAQFNSRHPLDLPDADPVAELKEFAKTSAPSAGGDLALAKTAGQLNSTDSKGEPRQRSVSFETAFRDALGWRINQLDSIRTDARSRWGRVRQDAWITESKLRPDLQARFASGVSFLRGSNEQTRYLNIVRESYSAELSNIDRMLDVCRNDVQRVDEFARSTSRTTVALVTVLRNQLRSYEDLNLDASLTTTMASALSEIDVATQAPRLDESCKSYTAAVFVPELPQRGQGWGPLANIFDWLLATDSLDVVVIIGMLGAGLFGSAVGTFVTATVRRRTPGIPDGFMSHLIRSFAATMIVYLGLKTGIAFAAVGNPDPDPYLMLFLCFLGTVYSDDVWKWAKRTGANYWTTTQENETAAPRRSTRTSESDSSS